MRTLICALALLLAGCSERAVYQNLQSDHELRCQRQPPSMYDDCMRGAGQRYDDYRREREQALADSETEH